jgi:hypothetical protein
MRARRRAALAEGTVTMEGLPADLENTERWVKRSRVHRRPNVAYVRPDGRGFQSPRVNPYQPLTSRRGAWPPFPVSSLTREMLNLHGLAGEAVPLDIIEKQYNRPKVDTVGLYSMLTGSKKQKPVQQELTPNRARRLRPGLPGLPSLTSIYRLRTFRQEAVPLILLRSATNILRGLRHFGLKDILNI